MRNLFSRRLQKMLSGSLALVFFFADLAFAAPGGHLASVFHPEKRDSESGWLAMELPEELATVQEVHVSESTSQPSFILIQDAHASYDGQKKIESILNFLQEHAGIDLLFLEGAEAGQLVPEQFRFFGQASRNRKVAELLAQRGEIGGPELFLVSADAEVKGFGAEEKEVYWQNLLNYRRVIAREASTTSYIESLKNAVNFLGSHYFNPELRNFLKGWLFYLGNQTELVRHLSVLGEYASTHLQLDFKDPLLQWEWPQLVRYFKIKELESQWNMPEAMRERDRLLDLLRQEKSTGSLVQKLQAMPQEFPGSPRSFFEDIYRAFPSGSFQFTDYPHFSRYVVFETLRRELDGAALFEEADRLTHQVNGALARTDEEKKLLEILADVWLLSRLYRLEVTREEYDTILKRRSQLRPAAMEERIDSFPEITEPLRVRGSSNIEHTFERALAFYQGALERDRVMAETISRQMKENGQQRAVVVAGGFHSQGLKEHWKATGSSYAEMMPVISVLDFDQEKHYRDSLMGQLAGMDIRRSQIKSPVYIQPSLMAPAHYPVLAEQFEKRFSISLADALAMPAGELEDVVGRQASADDAELLLKFLQMQVAIYQETQIVDAVVDVMRSEMEQDENAADAIRYIIDLAQHLNENFQLKQSEGDYLFAGKNMQAAGYVVRIPTEVIEERIVRKTETLKLHQARLEGPPAVADTLRPRDDASRIQPARTRVRESNEEIPVWTSNLDFPVRSETRSDVISISENAVEPIQPRADGGFLVDQESGTISYYGTSARDYLARTDSFSHETQIALPSHAAVELTAEGETYVLDAPGSVLVRPGTKLKIRVLKGDVLVITSEKQPDWYERYGPGGKFSDLFFQKGYNHTGLSWRKEGVLVFRLSDRYDLWNPQRKTEWLSDSMMVSRPLNSISRVTTERDGAMLATDIRPQERIHKHPTHQGRLTELYLVTQGQAILLSVLNGKPYQTLLQKGDIGVMIPGTPHQLFTIYGPYEHLVVQVPSVFQYSLNDFKWELSAEEFGINMREEADTALHLMTEAAESLKRSESREEASLMAQLFYGTSPLTPELKETFLSLLPAPFFEVLEQTEDYRLDQLVWSEDSKALEDLPEEAMLMMVRRGASALNVQLVLGNQKQKPVAAINLAYVSRRKELSINAGFIDSKAYREAARQEYPEQTYPEFALWLERGILPLAQALGAKSINIFQSVLPDKDLQTLEFEDMGEQVWVRALGEDTSRSESRDAETELEENILDLFGENYSDLNYAQTSRYLIALLRKSLKGKKYQKIMEHPEVQEMMTEKKLTALSEDIMLQLIQAMLERGKRGRAKEEAEILIRGLEFAYGYHYAHARQGVTARIRRLSYERSLKFINALVMLSPENYEWALSQALIISHTGDREEAERKLEALFEKGWMRNAERVTLGYNKIELVRQLYYRPFMDAVKARRWADAHGLMADGLVKLREARSVLKEITNKYRRERGRKDKVSLAAVPRAFYQLANAELLAGEFYLSVEQQEEWAKPRNFAMDALEHGVRGLDQAIESLRVADVSDLTLEHAVKIYKDMLSFVHRSLIVMEGKGLDPATMNETMKLLNQLRDILAEKNEYKIPDQEARQMIAAIKKAETAIRLQLDSYQEIRDYVLLWIRRTAQEDFASMDAFARSVLTHIYDDSQIRSRDAGNVLIDIIENSGWDLADLAVIKGYDQLNEGERNFEDLALFVELDLERIETETELPEALTTQSSEQWPEELKKRFLAGRYDLLELHFVIADEVEEIVSDETVTVDVQAYNMGDVAYFIKDDAKWLEQYGRLYEVVTPWLTAKEAAKLRAHYTRVEAGIQEFRTRGQKLIEEQKEKKLQRRELEPELRMLKFHRAGVDGTGGYAAIRRDLQSLLKHHRNFDVENEIRYAMNQIQSGRSRIEQLYEQYHFSWLQIKASEMSALGERMLGLLTGKIGDPHYLSKEEFDELVELSREIQEEVQFFMDRHRPTLDHVMELSKKAQGKMEILFQIASKQIKESLTHEYEAILEDFSNLTFSTRFESEGQSIQERLENLESWLDQLMVVLATAHAMGIKIEELWTEFNQNRGFWDARAADLAEPGDETLETEIEQMMRRAATDFIEVLDMTVERSTLSELESRLEAFGSKLEPMLSEIDEKTKRLIRIKRKILAKEVGVARRLVSIFNDWIENEVLSHYRGPAEAASDMREKIQKLRGVFHRAEEIIAAETLDWDALKVFLHEFSNDFSDYVASFQNLILGEVRSNQTHIQQAVFKVAHEMDKYPGWLSRSVFQDVSALQVAVHPSPGGYPEDYEIELFDKDRKHLKDLMRRLARYVRGNKDEFRLSMGIAEINGITSAYQSAMQSTKKWKKFNDTEFSPPVPEVIESMRNIMILYMANLVHSNFSPLLDFESALKIAFEVTHDNISQMIGKQKSGEEAQVIGLSQRDTEYKKAALDFVLMVLHQTVPETKTITYQPDEASLKLAEMTFKELSILRVRDPRMASIIYTIAKELGKTDMIEEAQETSEEGTSESANESSNRSESRLVFDEAMTMSAPDLIDYSAAEQRSESRFTAEEMEVLNSAEALLGYTFETPDFFLKLLNSDQNAPHNRSLIMLGDYLFKLMMLDYARASLNDWPVKAIHRFIDISAKEKEKQKLSDAFKTLYYRDYQGKLPKRNYYDRNRFLNGMLGAVAADHQNLRQAAFALQPVINGYFDRIAEEVKASADPRIRSASQAVSTDLYEDEIQALSAWVAPYLPNGMDAAEELRGKMLPIEGRTSILMDAGRHAVLGDAILDLIFIGSSFSASAEPPLHTAMKEQHDRFVKDPVLARLMAMRRGVDAKLWGSETTKYQTQVFEALIGIIYEANGGLEGQGLERAAEYVFDFYRNYLADEIDEAKLTENLDRIGKIFAAALILMSGPQYDGLMIAGAFTAAGAIYLSRYVQARREIQKTEYGKMAKEVSALAKDRSKNIFRSESRPEQDEAKSRGERNLYRAYHAWEKVAEQLRKNSSTLTLDIGFFYHQVSSEGGLPFIPQETVEGYMDRDITSLELPSQAVRAYMREPSSSLIAELNPFWHQFLEAARGKTRGDVFGIDVTVDARYFIHRARLEFEDPSYRAGKRAHRIAVDKPEDIVTIHDIRNQKIEMTIAEILDRLTPAQRRQLERNRMLIIAAGENLSSSEEVILYHRLSETVKETYRRIRESPEARQFFEKMGMHETQAQNQFITAAFFVPAMIVVRDVTQSRRMAELTYQFLKSGPDHLTHNRNIRMLHVGGAYHYRSLKNLFTATPVFQEIKRLKLGADIFEPREKITESQKGQPFFVNHLVEILDHTEIHENGMELDADYFESLFGQFLASGEFSFLLGQSFLKLRKYEQAIEVFEQALQLYPDDAAILYNLAAAYEGAGQRENAISVYQQVLEQEPKHPAALASLAEAYFRARLYEEAGGMYERAIAVNAAYVKLYLDYANLKTTQQDWEGALKLLVQGLAVASPDYEHLEILRTLWYSLRHVLNNLGEKDLAAMIEREILTFPLRDTPRTGLIAVWKAVSERYSLAVSDFSLREDQKEDSAKAIPDYAQWIAEGKGKFDITLPLDQKVFHFQYRQLGDSADRTGLLHALEVYEGQNKIGFIHFKTVGSSAITHMSFRGESLSNAGIFVLPLYRYRYRGIGRTLMNMAAHLAKTVGTEIFQAREVENEEFFSNAGFSRITGGDYELSLKSFDEKLPVIEARARSESREPPSIVVERRGGAVHVEVAGRKFWGATATHFAKKWEEFDASLGPQGAILNIRASSGEIYIQMKDGTEFNFNFSNLVNVQSTLQEVYHRWHELEVTDPGLFSQWNSDTEQRVFTPPPGDVKTLALSPNIVDAMVPQLWLLMNELTKLEIPAVIYGGVLRGLAFATQFQYPLPISEIDLALPMNYFLGTNDAFENFQKAQGNYQKELTRRIDEFGHRLDPLELDINNEFGLSLILRRNLEWSISKFWLTYDASLKEFQLHGLDQSIEDLKAKRLRLAGEVLQYPERIVRLLEMVLQYHRFGFHAERESLERLQSELDKSHFQEGGQYAELGIKARELMARIKTIAAPDLGQQMSLWQKESDLESILENISAPTPPAEKERLKQLHQQMAAVQNEKYTNGFVYGDEGAYQVIYFHRDLNYVVKGLLRHGPVKDIHSDMLYAAKMGRDIFAPFVIVPDAFMQENNIALPEDRGDIHTDYGWMIQQTAYSLKDHIHFLQDQWSLATAEGDVAALEQIDSDMRLILKEWRRLKYRGWSLGLLLWDERFEDVGITADGELRQIGTYFDKAWVKFFNGASPTSELTNNANRKWLGQIFNEQLAEEWYGDGLNRFFFDVLWPASNLAHPLRSRPVAYAEREPLLTDEEIPAFKTDFLSQLKSFEPPDQASENRSESREQEVPEVKLQMTEAGAMVLRDLYGGILSLTMLSQMSRSIFVALMASLGWSHDAESSLMPADLRQMLGIPDDQASRRHFGMALIPFQSDKTGAEALHELEELVSSLALVIAEYPHKMVMIMAGGNIEVQAVEALNRHLEKIKEVEGRILVIPISGNDHGEAILHLYQGQWSQEKLAVTQELFRKADQVSRRLAQKAGMSKIQTSKWAEYSSVAGSESLLTGHTDQRSFLKWRLVGEMMNPSERAALSLLAVMTAGEDPDKEPELLKADQIKDNLNVMEEWTRFVASLREDASIKTHLSQLFQAAQQIWASA